MAITAKAKPEKRTSRRSLVNDRGRRIGVVLSMREYEELVEAAEQRDDIRHLEAARFVKGKDITLEALGKRLRAEGKLR
jgi:hypothetical protein